jgi:hypothetical protein
MLVGFFREFAEAEEAVGNATGAASLRSLADEVAAAVDRHLWDAAGGDDHFVTQLNPDGSVRDFVDYDANFIALAHGVTSQARAARFLRRVEGSRCWGPGRRATYVSERYYGKGDTAKGNVGDSACTMARIGYYEALARRRYGDIRGFNEFLLNPIRDDLLQWTWMHERCAGVAMHAS